MQALEARRLQWGVLGVTLSPLEGWIWLFESVKLTCRCSCDAEVGQGDAVMGSNRRTCGLVIGVCVCG